MAWRRTIEQVRDWTCSHSRRTWSFICGIRNELLVGKWCYGVENSNFLAGVDCAVENLSVFLKSWLNALLSDIASQTSNESHEAFLRSEGSENESTLWGNFEISVEVFQRILSSFNTGEGDQNLTGLVTQLLDSNLFSELSEFLELVLNLNKNVRKVISKVLVFQIFELMGWS